MSGWAANGEKKGEESREKYRGFSKKKEKYKELSGRKKGKGDWKITGKKNKVTNK